MLGIYSKMYLFNNKRKKKKKKRKKKLRILINITIIMLVLQGSSIMDPEYRGIIPRTVASIFEGVAAADQNVEFTIKVDHIHEYTRYILVMGV